MSQPQESELVAELRRLILASAPDPELAEPVARCGLNDPLDGAIPFSSLIVLGTVVAVEDRFGVKVSKAALATACEGGEVTLRKLAAMIASLQAEKASA